MYKLSSIPELDEWLKDIPEESSDEQMMGWQSAAKRIQDIADSTDDPEEAIDKLEAIIERTPTPKTDRDQGRLSAFQDAMEAIGGAVVGDNPVAVEDAPPANNNVDDVARTTPTEMPQDPSRNVTGAWYGDEGDRFQNFRDQAWERAEEHEMPGEEYIFFISPEGKVDLYQKDYYHDGPSFTQMPEEGYVSGAVQEDIGSSGFGNDSYHLFAYPSQVSQEVIYPEEMTSGQVLGLIEVIESTKSYLQDSLSSIDIEFPKYDFDGTPDEAISWLNQISRNVTSKVAAKYQVGQWIEDEDGDVGVILEVYPEDFTGDPSYLISFPEIGEGSLGSYTLYERGINGLTDRRPDINTKQDVELWYEGEEPRFVIMPDGEYLTTGYYLHSDLTRQMGALTSIFMNPNDPPHLRGLIESEVLSVMSFWELTTQQVKSLQQILSEIPHINEVEVAIGDDEDISMSMDQFKQYLQTNEVTGKVAGYKQAIEDFKFIVSPDGYYYEWPYEADYHHNDAFSDIDQGFDPDYESGSLGGDEFEKRDEYISLGWVVGHFSSSMMGTIMSYLTDDVFTEEQEVIFWDLYEKYQPSSVEVESTNISNFEEMARNVTGKVAGDFPEAEEYLEEGNDEFDEVEIYSAPIEGMKSKFLIMDGIGYFWSNEGQTMMNERDGGPMHIDVMDAILENYYATEENQWGEPEVPFDLSEDLWKNSIRGYYRPNDQQSLFILTDNEPTQETTNLIAQAFPNEEYYSVNWDYQIPLKTADLIEDEMPQDSSRNIIGKIAEWYDEVIPFEDLQISGQPVSDSLQRCIFLDSEGGFFWNHSNYLHADVVESMIEEGVATGLNDVLGFGEYNPKTETLTLRADDEPNNSLLMSILDCLSELEGYYHNYHWTSTTEFPDMDEDVYSSLKLSNYEEYDEDEMMQQWWQGEMDKAEKQDKRDLYQVIMDEGGISTRDDLREEYRLIPNTYKRKDGLRGDDMADVLSQVYPQFGIHSENDLIHVLHDMHRQSFLQRKSSTLSKEGVEENVSNQNEVGSKNHSDLLVYRGLNIPESFLEDIETGIDWEELGEFWSTEYQIAYDYASGMEELEDLAVILHGEVVDAGELHAFWMDLINRDEIDEFLRSKGYTSTRHMTQGDIQEVEEYYGRKWEPNAEPVLNPSSFPQYEVRFGYNGVIFVQKADIYDNYEYVSTVDIGKKVVINPDDDFVYSSLNQKFYYAPSKKQSSLSKDGEIRVSPFMNNEDVLAYIGNQPEEGIYNKFVFTRNQSYYWVPRGENQFMTKDGEPSHTLVINALLSVGEEPIAWGTLYPEIMGGGPYIAEIRSDDEGDTEEAYRRLTDSGMEISKTAKEQPGEEQFRALQQRSEPWENPDPDTNRENLKGELEQFGVTDQPPAEAANVLVFRNNHFYWPTQNQELFNEVTAQVELTHDEVMQRIMEYYPDATEQDFQVGYYLNGTHELYDTQGNFLGNKGGEENELSQEESVEDVDLSDADPQEVINYNKGQDLEGLPTKVKVRGMGEMEWHSHGGLQDLSKEYNDYAGIDKEHPADYVPVQPEISERIAQEFEQMQHDPHNPEVQEAYDALISETIDQYQGLVDNGYTFEFYPEEDPYPNSPREAVMDIQRNKHMYVYPTDEGFGSGDEEYPDHPLMQETGIEWNGKPVLANDLFRAVHDLYGHAKEGVGFRSDGEDNAYRQHSAMFSDKAQRALTSETRGQNSWVNYHPDVAAHNQTAGQADTIFAPQKAGLMPDWVNDPDIHKQNREAKLGSWWTKEASPLMQNAPQIPLFENEQYDTFTRGEKVTLYRGITIYADSIPEAIEDIPNYWNLPFEGDRAGVYWTEDPRIAQRIAESPEGDRSPQESYGDQYELVLEADVNYEDVIADWNNIPDVGRVFDYWEEVAQEWWVAPRSGEWIHQSELEDLILNDNKLYISLYNTIKEDYYREEGEYPPHNQLTNMIVDILRDPYYEMDLIHKVLNSHSYDRGDYAVNDPDYIENIPDEFYQEYFPDLPEDWMQTDQFTYGEDEQEFTLEEGSPINLKRLLMYDNGSLVYEQSFSKIMTAKKADFWDDSEDIDPYDMEGELDKEFSLDATDLENSDIKSDPVYAKVNKFLYANGQAYYWDASEDIEHIDVIESMGWNIANPRGIYMGVYALEESPLASMIQVPEINSYDQNIPAWVAEELDRAFGSPTIILNGTHMNLHQNVMAEIKSYDTGVIADDTVNDYGVLKDHFTPGGYNKFIVADDQAYVWVTDPSTAKPFHMAMKKKIKGENPSATMQMTGLWSDQQDLYGIEGLRGNPLVKILPSIDEDKAVELLKKLFPDVPYAYHPGLGWINIAGGSVEQEDDTQINVSESPVSGANSLVGNDREIIFWADDGTMTHPEGMEILYESVDQAAEDPSIIFGTYNNGHAEIDGYDENAPMESIRNLMNVADIQSMNYQGKPIDVRGEIGIFG